MRDLVDELDLFGGTALVWKATRRPVTSTLRSASGKGPPHDPDRDLWEIGVMPWYETEPPRIHGVLVDAVTGTIRGPLDRPWDQDVDPFP